VFDSTKARVKDTEAVKYIDKIKKEKANDKKGNESDNGKIKGMAKWKREHEMFMAMVRSNKKGEESSQEDQAIIKKMMEEDPDMVKCPHCGRTFNKEASERHIPICLKLNSRPKPSPNRSNINNNNGNGDTHIGRPTATSARSNGNIGSNGKTPTKMEQGGNLKVSTGGSRWNQADSMVPCPHCDRKFEKHAAERHIPICQSVTNKPKKLQQKTNPVSRR
jgi:endogenous inhibitor of DNA gyrase (YacG/DUF329 family)